MDKQTYDVVSKAEAQGAIVRPDGELEWIRPKVGAVAGGSWLGVMYEALEQRSIDRARIDETSGAWVGDESLFTEEPNPTVSLMVQLLSGLSWQGQLAGRTLLLGEDGPETVPLSDDQKDGVEVTHAAALRALRKAGLVEIPEPATATQG